MRLQKPSPPLHCATSFRCQNTKPLASVHDMQKTTTTTCPLTHFEMMGNAERGAGNSNIIVY
jgi:hypothetical protein